MHWKPVVGFEEVYEVSEFGDVRRIKPAQGTRRGMVLKPLNDGRGYTVYNLQSPVRRVRAKAHRLVLEAFVGASPDGMWALHYDDNPQNNHVSNLRWGSPRDNMADRMRNSGWDLGPNHNGAKTHCKHGHEFTPENTRLKREKRDPYPYLHRICRICARASARRSELKRQRRAQAARNG